MKKDISSLLAFYSVPAPTVEDRSVAISCAARIAAKRKDLGLSIFEAALVRSVPAAGLGRIDEIARLGALVLDALHVEMASEERKGSKPKLGRAHHAGT
jgi:hypothetical protein